MLLAEYHRVCVMSRTKKAEFEGVRATRPLKPVNTLVDKYLNRYRGIIAGKEKTASRLSA
jgi:hypothetical protein